jgi:HD superfamily phosphohydrolase
MEFHDILHGHIRFAPGEPLTSLLQELINSPEINRLRNMRQMNFDVPLIQELGRSRRLPHSIGVAHISSRLARINALSLEESKVLIAASLLHDAAIPPYGHLVESEFKSVDPGFKHERRVEELINGTINTENKYTNIVPGRSLQVSNILNRYEIDHKQVFDVICPAGDGGTPLVADIDIDNIDNVHRMAAMLGWPGAKENADALIAEVSLRGLGRMAFSKASLSHLRRWLDFRQKIYTMIIAHPECIPYNMLQTDLVRIAVSNGIISPDDWYLSEPEFEEALRSNTSSKVLAQQLISGCEYQLIDYVWVKNFDVTRKLSNKEISEHLSETTGYSSDYCYFIWNEKGLICRKVQVNGANWDGRELGESSTSCMIALVKRTPGKPKWTKAQANKWRRDALDQFVKLFEENQFDVDFPETYTGSFFGSGNGEISVEYK